MLRSVESMVELFRSEGLKITPQRRVIFETVAQDDSHPTAEELYQRVLSVMPDISRTTVYNTLRELLALGVLVEVEDLTQAGTRYDTNTRQHQHLFCMSCHRLTDIGRDFEGLELAPDETAGYDIVRHQVTFYGYYPDCQ
ncbi:MAG TPA: Fur family transcriptional regulator [Anaerolineae bacterium]|nr:Fur family transcriptional regulator [Anaerolineae bacterium]